MADAVIDAARRQGRRRRALFRRRAGAGLGGTAVSGRLAVVGLGPGDAALADAARPKRRSPRADALYGYGPYLDRVPPRAGPDAPSPPTTARKRARAAAALRHAARGRAASPSSRAAIPACSPWRRRCARRSRRDREPGARSTSRSCPASPRCWRSPRASARRSGTISARISLSDNLKPWELIERRLDAAAGAGFVIALYNPISRARPWQLGAAFERLRQHLPAVDAGDLRPRGRPARRAASTVTTLAAADPAAADMATLRHHRLAGDARDRAARPAAAGLHAALGRRGAAHDRARPRASSTVSTAGTSGSAGRRSMITGEAERARRRDLAVGRGAAAVLRDHDLDAVLARAARARRLRRTARGR